MAEKSQYEQLYELALKYWAKAEGWIEVVPWGYVGIAIFAILFGLFIYDTLAGSQTSIWFVVGIMFLLFLTYFVTNSMF